MKKISILFILFSSIFSKVFAQHYYNYGTVVFANVLFRHGDRTPMDPYPKDPHKNESEWPVPFAQLTPIGMHQQLLLGRWLRSRYSHLLSNYYSRNDIYIRSSDVDRTLMSAEANLAGLYPPIGNQIWDSIKWMPIPVHTVPELQDSFLSGRKICPRYDYEYSKLLNSPTFKKIDTENAALYEYLTRNTGQKINSLQLVNNIYNTLWIENLYNKTLPKWTQSVYPDKLERLASLSFTTQAYNKILQRLKIGPLLGEMIRHMILKSKNFLSPNRNIYMYSAHDDTIANFLKALQIFEPHCPPYAATVLVELRKNASNQYLVTISYKNSSDEPILFKMPDCETACPLEDFVKLTKSVIPQDLEKECQMHLDDDSFNVNIPIVIAIMTSVVLMLIIVVLLIIIVVYWHYKRSYSQYYLRLSTEPI